MLHNEPSPPTDFANGLSHSLVACMFLDGSSQAEVVAAAPADDSWSSEGDGLFQAQTIQKAR